MKNYTSHKKISLQSFWIKDFFAIILFILPLVSGAQSIFDNPITGTTPSATNPYTTGQTVASNISVSGIGRGSGLSSNPGNDRYNCSGWSTGSSLVTTDYFTFTLTPDANYAINFVSFVYTGQKSGTGPTSYALRSSLDGFSANIGSPTTGGATISLSASTYQNITSAIEFRFYAWNASGGSGTYSINDFTFNGTVCAATPTASSPQTFCGAATVANLTATGTAIKWYTSSSGGSALASGTALSTGTYYATQTLSGCESKTRKSVSVVVNTLPSISVQPSTAQQYISSGNTVTPLTVTATGTGISYQWFSNTIASNSGGSSLGSANGAQTATYTPPTNVVGTTYYYVVVSGTCTPAATSDVSGAIIIPEEYTWNVASGDWTTPASWTPARNSPSSLDVLKFDGNTQATPTVNVDITETVGEIRLSNTANVTFSATSSGTPTASYLIVNTGSTLALDANNINVTGTLTGPGAVTSTTGAVTLNGSSAQTITGSPVVTNIILNNTNGATISSGTLSVAGVYTHTLGTLTTNGNLVLTATAATTYGQIAGTGTGDISGNVTAEFFIPSTATNGFRGISSPFTGNTVNDLSDDININYGTPSFLYSSVYTFNEADGGSSARGAWQAVTSSAQSMDNNGFVFVIYDADLDSNLILDLTGTYNKGDYTTPALSRTGAMADTSGWHLLRNPWPSNYNHNSTITNLVSNTIYVYEGNAVRDWNGTTGTLANGIVPPFHTINAQINTDGNTLTFPAANRTTSNSANYLDKTSLFNYVALKVTNAKNEWDETRVYTNDAAENGKDFWDAAKMVNGAALPTIYTVVEGEKTSINNLKNIPAEGIVVPVEFKSQTGGIHTMSFTLDNIDPSVEVILEDRFKNTMHPIAQGNYEFTHNPNFNAAYNRFNLRFEKKSSTAVKEIADNDIFIGSNGNNVVVSFINEGNYSIEVYDLMGRVLATESNVDAPATSTKTVTVNGVATGYYIVRVTGTNSFKTAKVFLK